MKRLHIHIRTKDLEKSVAFYSALFSSPPEKQKDDYARWLLDDPVAHVSLSSYAGATDGAGIDHVGISLDDDEELSVYESRLEEAKAQVRTEEATVCCYANSNKRWTQAPDGEIWELFHSKSDTDMYGTINRPASEGGTDNKQACCRA